MPQQKSLYDQLAIEYGHVDPDDPKAIEHFYEVTLHTLPREIGEAILDKLIAADDMFDTGEEFPPGFDASGRRFADLPDVPLPLKGPPGALEADMAEMRLQIQRADAADARAVGGVAAFFAIVKEWELSAEEARVLLGNISRDRFEALYRGDTATLHSLCDDESDRLNYVIGISAVLHTLYVPASHLEWLRNESRLPAEAMSRPWGTVSPLGYLLTGKVSALEDVYAYVMAEREAT